MSYLAMSALSIGLVLTLAVLSQKSGSVVHDTLFRSRWQAWSLIVGGGFLIRLLYFFSNSAHDDSHIYIANAQQILAGSPKINPHIGVEFVMAGFILLLGPVGANVASLVFAVLTIPLIGIAATELFDSGQSGLYAGFVFGVTPIHIYFSAFAITEAISLFFLILGIVLVLRERYLAGFVIGAMIFFMRIEYSLFILFPFFLLQLGEDWRIDYLVAVGPIASFLFVILSRYTSPTVYQQSIFPALRFIGWSLPFSFDPINQFLLNPINHVGPRILFYATHLSHWGIPYWEPLLINPILSLFALYGLYLLISRSRLSSALIFLAAFLTVSAIAYREFVSPSSALGLLLVAVFSVTLIAVTGTQWEIPTSRRLFLATVPFWGVLSVFYFATRYLLPLLAVYSLYSGYGLFKILEQLPRGTTTQNMSNNQLIYVANARLPSRKAHPYQIVQMCDGFESAGFDVTLVVPERRPPAGTPAESPEEYFDTPFKFDLVQLPCIDFLHLAPALPNSLAQFVFYLQTTTFALTALLYVGTRKSEFVFSRALLFSVFGAPLFGDQMAVELHRIPSRNWVATFLGKIFNRLRGVVVISDGLKQDWKRFTQTPIKVEPDCVRLDRFDGLGSKESIRERLGLPTKDPIVMYTGSLKKWKGVETLVKAGRELPMEVTVCIVGGYKEAIERIRRECRLIPESVRFVGHVKPDAVPRYLRASDVLVLPNTGEKAISARYTSPLKLFEYMAAERPIISSDLPSTREVLTEDLCFFFTPDDASDLAYTIREVLDNPEQAEQVASNAREEVTEYTWAARARRIEAFLKKEV